MMAKSITANRRGYVFKKLDGDVGGRAMALPQRLYEMLRYLDS